MKAVMNELEKMMISFFSLMKFILLLVQGATGSLDASNMFKPALARGETKMEQQH
jgi:ATP-dependent Clp protease ATP-binding subunit ClpA